ncbi:hypothetical protein BYT27DRAFT_7240947 [Phlegmacium glaucopus]|nr:hypothetical protein BYT27DRAFT_7240947 [Phlegmacium glaucopus]
MSGSGSNKGNFDTGSTSERKQDKVSIVELKNGKVVFKQKPISFEKQSDTLQEIVKFREMLEDRINQQSPPLTAFPDEHRPLIAKLAHESDKSLPQLSKHIHHELLPTLDEDDNKDTSSLTHAALPLALVENAIKAVLMRNNYGLDAPSNIKIPAAVCVWRWEVKSEHLDWLPKNSREKAEARQTDRIQAREDLKVLFEALSQEERDAIIDPKGTSKLPVKELNTSNGEGTSQNSDLKSDDIKASSSNSKRQGKKKAAEVENDITDVKTSRPKKSQDPEKTVKEKERLEKKLARAEREKKEKEAQNKSQSIMAKFFAKPKASSPAEVAVAVAGPSKLQSDFERTFKPFVLQKDKVLAPVNWFLVAKRRRKPSYQTDVIIIDNDEEVEDVKMQMQDTPTSEELINMTSQERLHNILSSLPPPAYPSRLRRAMHPQSKPSLQYKTYHPLSVRDIMSQLSEAEIGQNDDLVRVIVDKLRDRTLLPAKALSFHTDARPGYFGTWTRSSRVIGARAPLAKDTLVFDYGYDSGEEWEEEAVGDADDVVDDGEEEDGDGEEPDSDLESWLVDDDDEPAISIHDKDSPPPLLDLTVAAPTLKRKADDAEKKSGKKRKVVLPLTPFAKGPIWESSIGQCDYDPFNPYRIQLFNDTPFPIDPFSYVSTCIEDHKASLRTTNGAHADDVVFAVPALPPRLAASNSAESSSSSSTKPPVPKKASVTNRAPFPECHLGFLLNKITQLQASSINALVESIYLELREHKVKKTAIEAKLREVGEKCKEKKVWVVKPALLGGIVPLKPSFQTNETPGVIALDQQGS